MHARRTLEDVPAEDDAPRGLVRFNAPPALVHGFLFARLAEFSLFGA